MNKRLLLTCLTLCLAQKALCAPLNPAIDKPGAEQVKEAVQKAEQDATRAAQEAVRRGHKAESRIEEEKTAEPQNDGSTEQGEQDKPAALKHIRKHASLASESDEGPHIKRVKEHKVNQKPSGMSKMLGLSEMGELGGGNNDYKEDTRLEDRLALEAEEEKKYETGEGYGGGGGNGGGWDDGTKGVNWATNIQRQDAAEKQSIQAQVASESAHELDEIQRAIAAESQSSRGSASIANGGASVVGGTQTVMQDPEGMQSRISRPSGGQSMGFEGSRPKSLSPGDNQGFQQVLSPFTSTQSQYDRPEISNMIHQADKISPAVMRGAEQQSNMEMGNLGSRGAQEQVGLGGLEGAQQLGSQGQGGGSMEQVPMGASARANLGGGLAGGMEGGGMDAGGLGQEILGQPGLAGGGMTESQVGRMTGASLGGGGMQGLQPVQGMQSMSSAFTGGQSSMLSNGGGGVAGVPAQALMEAGLQGGMQGGLQGGVQGGMQGGIQSGMQGGMQGAVQGIVGGSIPGLSSMNGVADYGQQQMAFKKSTIAGPSDLQRSKTHTKEETKRKIKKVSHKDLKSDSFNRSFIRTHSVEDKKTISDKKVMREDRKHIKRV